MRQVLVRWAVVCAALAGCGESGSREVSPEERVEVADRLASARTFDELFLDLARWYREIYTPPLDFDGDGYADFATAVSAFGAEQIDVFYGGPGGFSATPDTVIPSPLPNAYIALSETALAGDTNGDGYADLIAGANGANGNGSAYIYLGGPSGLATTPSQTLLGNATGVPTAAFGYQVSGAKDVDLDGYDDVIVAAIASPNPAPQSGVAFVYRGGPTGVDPVPAWTLSGTGGRLDSFGSSLVSTYLNHDAWPDLVIGEARNVLFGGNSTGRVHVFLGGPAGYTATATQVLTSPDGPLQGFGFAVASIGDTNLDGHGDFVVGEPLLNGATGRAYVYFGTPTGVDPVPGLQLDPPAGNTGGYFGWSVGGGGDADRDGFADVAVGETDAVNLEGRAHLAFGPFLVWPGAGNPVVVPADQTIAGTHTGLGFFGQALSFVGDADGNRADELLVGAPSADVRGRIYTFEGTTPGSVAPDQTIASPLSAAAVFGLSLSR